MNLAVLRETAQGLADAMRAEGVAMRAAIVYDTRRDSRRFAHAVAAQLAANDIDVILVDAPRPTPLLSYIVRARCCGAGVVISASHNPAGDNGIKVFGPDGAQVLGARSDALMTAIERAMAAPLPDAPVRVDQDPRVEVLRSAEQLASVDDPYLAFVRAQGVAGDDLSACGLRVVFTPLHGVGHHSVLPVLRAKNIEVHMVEAQGPDDGRFGTVSSANPELPEALQMARELAEDLDADLVLANDPDADRLGAMARDSQGRFVFIDGHRLGVLMLDHVLRAGPPSSERGWVLTTVCTTPLLRALCEPRGVSIVDDLLVGFKHHAGMMAEQPERTCIFATEEAHGYLRGDDVHDKDGAIAALLLAEVAALAKAEAVTPFDRLQRVWLEHGYHREATANIYAYGQAGREAIAALMSAWRADPPKTLGGFDVASVIDRARPRNTGSPTRDLPGNVLVFELAPREGVAARLVVRPSGTEPKAKIYALVHAAPPAGPDALDEDGRRVDKAAQQLLDDARAQAESVMAPLLSGST